MTGHDGWNMQETLERLDMHSHAGAWERDIKLDLYKNFRAVDLDSHFRGPKKSTGPVCFQLERGLFFV